MSETATMTLTEFLLARIAEDEAVAVRLAGSSYLAEQVRSGRVLAECEAKRRIVGYAGIIADDPTLPSTHLARHVLVDLAAVYADHPDFRPEWKP